MKKSINVIGHLSIVLISCVLIGQVGWLYHTHNVKISKFNQNTSYLLTLISEKHFNKESTNIVIRYGFRCGLKNNMTTFTWGTSGEMEDMKLNPQQELSQMSPLVTYDYLYNHQLLDLQEISSAYDTVLQEKGIFQSPILLLRDRVTKEILMTTDSLYSLKAKILTTPIDVGHKCKHQLVAAFNAPPFSNDMFWHLILEGVLFICFVFCLIWQWHKTKMTYRSAEVQTMGIAHFEHELKVPIQNMLSPMVAIIDRKNKPLTEVDEQQLRRVYFSLKKMLDVIDTMLTSLKNSRLEIKRITIDVQQEMEMVVEMFASTHFSAKVEFHIDKGAEKALLDNVYFNCLLINLVDNAIKYNNTSPEVKIYFGKEGEYWILKVADNGVGISLKDKKRIFRQFYRVNKTQKKGFGLGLAFVKKVANAYDGDVDVKSELGQGSIFTIRLK